MLELVLLLFTINARIVIKEMFLNIMIMFIMFKMEEVKQIINIKNRTYYFYNDIIDLKTFDARLLKIDKKIIQKIGIYNIGYIKKKKIDDCENIYGVNPLYLFIDHANRYIEEKDLNPLYLIIDRASGYIKEKSVNKYLVFDSTNENKELLKKHNDVWNGIKNEINQRSRQ